MTKDQIENSISQIEQSAERTTSKLALLDLLTHAEPSVRAYGRLLSTSTLSEFEKWVKAEIDRDIRPVDLALASQQFVGTLIINVIRHCALEDRESTALEAYLRTLTKGLSDAQIITVNPGDFGV